MKWLKKLFLSSEELEEQALQQMINNLLHKLPQCEKDVVIVSPKYGESHYTCEILATAESMLPWSESHADAVWSGIQEEQAARRTLPLWLRKAKVSGNSASYVTNQMYAVLRPYIMNFINKGTTKIFCPQCQSFVNDVQMKKINEKKMTGWLWWTDVWKCPNGHQLYYEEHEVHFHI